MGVIAVELSPRSSVDRAPVSGTGCAGSIPVGDTAVSPGIAWVLCFWLRAVCRIDSNRGFFRDIDITLNSPAKSLQMHRPYVD